MTKISKVLAVAMLVGGMTVTSCSSKEVASNEPVISGGTTVAETSTVESANVGGASSGQGR